MIRKLTVTLALAATFALGTAGLSSKPAAANNWGWHGGWQHHHHFFPRFGVRFYGGPVYASCWRPRYVATRWGTVRRIWVNVCY